MIPGLPKTPEIFAQNTPFINNPHRNTAFEMKILNLTAGTYKHRLRDKRHQVFHIDEGFPRNMGAIADIDDLHY